MCPCAAVVPAVAEGLAAPVWMYLDHVTAIAAVEFPQGGCCPKGSYWGCQGVKCSSHFCVFLPSRLCTFVSGMLAAGALLSDAAAVALQVFRCPCTVATVMSKLCWPRCSTAEVMCMVTHRLQGSSCSSGLVD